MLARVTTIKKYSAKVVSRHGAHLVVKDESNIRHTCISTKKFSQIVCGDHVICDSNAQDRDQVAKLLPRSNVLNRKTEFATKTVAANIDTIIIVCAIEPIPSVELIDHYILAAELMPAAVMIAVNKTDLANTNNLFALIKEKYSTLPYPVVKTNIHAPSGLDALTNHLYNKTCIFVGQSGVGKSSLINFLVPNLEIETQNISDQISQGKHTTSTTTLYDLPNGGELIDSPGVRDFTTPELNHENIALGFVEIQKYGRECKFNNCRHINEPHCAVKDAIANKEINQERYKAYKKLLELNLEDSRKN
ncbi:MAG: ribosome small subunit-dependent GTPase A [Pseudomonadota bacterium]